MTSPGKSSFSASPTRDDPLQQLRVEVDKLTERLDFMAPMLSLLNFTHDFVQRVECEASVQLLRLKNAKVAGDGDAAAEQNMIDTSRWLHTMTDLVMCLQSSRKHLSSDMPAMSPECSAHSPSPRLSAPSPTHRAPFRMGATAPLIASSATPLATATFGSDLRTPPAEARTTRPPVPKGTGKGGHGSAASSVSVASGTSASSGGTGAAGAPSVAPSAKLVGDAPRAGALESTLEFGGLALGRGTWANAYRQANGARRDALRLLCSTSIVTERELADDLTVISEEHVEECISIAGEMLRRWPAERGPPPRAEAKSFFEERLAAMYLRRAPAPFGAQR